jgi:endonuclease/exonuclease/phosphatase (EEP) superfamily protein YafD
VAAIGLGLGAVVALVPVWPLELAAHFRVQLLVAGLVITAAAGAIRAWRVVEGAAIATLAQLVFLAPYLTADARHIPPGAPLRVLFLNVHTSSTDYERVRRLVADTHPDILGLAEVDDRWLAELAPALGEYAGRIEHPRRDNFGVALYTRGALDGRAESLGGEVPTIVARTHVPGAEAIALVVAHPLPPVSRATNTAQAATLAAVAARVQALPGRVIVMGDLNATPWSAAFARFTGATGLCDTRDGFGIQATFPASSFVMRIPIDHVLVSCALGVRDRRVERDVGSDHLPVLVDLVVPVAP